MQHNYLVVVANEHYPPDHIESYVVSASKQIVTATECKYLAEYMRDCVCKEKYIRIISMSYLGAEVSYHPITAERVLDELGNDISITFYNAESL